MRQITSSKRPPAGPHGTNRRRRNEGEAGYCCSSPPGVESIRSRRRDAVTQMGHHTRPQIDRRRFCMQLHTIRAARRARAARGLAVLRALHPAALRSRRGRATRDHSTLPLLALVRGAAAGRATATSGRFCRAGPWSMALRGLACGRHPTAVPSEAVDGPLLGDGEVGVWGQAVQGHGFRVCEPFGS